MVRPAGSSIVTGLASRSPPTPVNLDRGPQWRMGPTVESAQQVYDIGTRWRHSYADLGPAYFTALPPMPLQDPYLVALNPALAGDLGLDSRALASPEAVEAFT